MLSLAPLDDELREKIDTMSLCDVGLWIHHNTKHHNAKRESGERGCSCEEEASESGGGG